MEHDRIAALATPMGTSALAVIRTSGPGTIESLATLTDTPELVRELAGNTLKRVLLVDPDGDEVIDEVVLSVFRAPRSYTGDDAVEITCHGSPAGITRIMRLLLAHGFRPADPGEFTERAFLAGKLDLTRAEAVHEIVTARTAAGHEMALRRLGGTIEAAINEVKGNLVRIMASIAVQLDYPEEDTGEVPIPQDTVKTARERLRELAATYETGRLYQEGIRIALAGRTNAGKSSLFNDLVREERAIVSALHGTTRDYLESHIDIRGVPAQLFDTAGLRTTDEAIEGEGIRRTRTVIEAADLVLYIVDGSAGIQADDTETLATLSPPVIRVWNKIDLESCHDVPDGWIGVSAQALTGFDLLEEAILAAVAPARHYRDGSPVIDSLRQKNLLERAARALDEVLAGVRDGYPVDAIGVDMQEALAALGEITGEVTSEDVLDVVFGGFCLGK